MERRFKGNMVITLNMDEEWFLLIIFTIIAFYNCEKTYQKDVSASKIVDDKKNTRLSSESLMPLICTMKGQATMPQGYEIVCLLCYIKHLWIILEIEQAHFFSRIKQANVV